MYLERSLIQKVLTYDSELMTSTQRLRTIIPLLVCLILFGLGLIYQRPNMIAPLNIYDEGIIVYGAVRVMDGQVPYRDFWTQYSPAQLYVLAALFKMLGKQIMVERWWDVVIRSCLALGMAGLAARLTSRIGGILVWVMGLLWVTYYGFFGYPIFQGLLFSLLSIAALTHALTRHPERPNELGGEGTLHWLILSGALLGIATLFRHDMAIYVGVAQTLVLLAHAFLHREWGEGLRRWLILVASALLTVLPVAVYLLVYVRADELLNQLLIFPLTIFPKVRDLPYPALKGELAELPFYAPFLIYALAGGIAVADVWRDYRARKGDREGRPYMGRPDTDRPYESWGVIMVVLFGLFGWNQARVRSDIIHTVQFFLPAIVLLPVLIRAATQRASLPRYICAAVAMTLGLAFSIAPIAKYFETRKFPDNVNTQLALKLAPPIAQGTIVSTEQFFAVQTIQRLTQPNEKVYVGLSNHSRVFANDVMFYFLMERHSPTRYHEIHPGLVNTVAVQREMIADLERNQVRYLVLTNMFEGAREPNDSALDSKVTLLDDYIKAHYQQSHTLGSYRILKRIKN